MIATCKPRDIETKNGTSIKTTRPEDFVSIVLPILGEVEDMVDALNKGELLDHIKTFAAIGDALDDLAYTTEQPSRNLIYAASKFAYLICQLLGYGATNKEYISIILEELECELINAINF